MGQSELEDMDLVPLGGRVVVEPSKAETKAGTLFIPDDAQKQPNDGIVLVLGHPLRDKDGAEVPFTVQEGDRVIYSPHAGFKVKWNGLDKLLMLETEMIAILKPKGHA